MASQGEGLEDSTSALSQKPQQLEQKQKQNGLENVALMVKTSPALPYSYNASWQLLSQGAEARVWFVPNYAVTTVTQSLSTNYCSRDSQTSSLESTTASAVCKERFHKSYRHRSLNVQLTKTRIKSEVKCITKCRKHGLNVPLILSVDLSAMCIFMEFLAGKTVREFLDDTIGRYLMKDYINDGFTDYEKESAMHQAMSVATAIGSIIAKMHNIHVIHGDLTTSNFILRGSAHVNNKSSPCLFLIDFGLALTGCTNPEEKAVDLYVLERAFISTHPGSDDLLAEIIRTYKRVCSSSDSVLQRLFNVRQRGRKRECFG